MRVNRKKAFILIGFFLFCNIFYAQNTKEKKPLVKIIKQLEKQFTCNFSYADINVENVFVYLPPNYTTLKETITFLDENTNLDFKILENNTITISLANGAKNFCGYLLDKETGEPIVNATLQARSEYSITDSEGYFELNNISKNEFISFKHISYKSVKHLPNIFVEGKCDNHFLVPKIESIREITIRNYLTKGIRKKIDGSYEINYENFGTLPGLIEADVLQTIQAIPGIQSVDETVSNINIRGGSHHENLILWDGIKMYQSGHFFGLISAFNPHLTKNATLLKNGTHANYSDGVSGTILMRTDEELTQKVVVETGLNLINIDALIDIPNSKKSSIQLAARRSYNDFIETPTYSSYFDKSFQNTEVVNNTGNVISFNDQFSFNDITARWLYHISDTDRIRVNLLSVSNELSFLENAIIDNIEESKESKASQNNLAASIFYNRKWNDRFSTDFQIYTTKYLLESKNFDILNNQRLIQENEVIEESIKLDSKYRLTNNLMFYNGYQYIETGVTSIQDVDNPIFRLKVKEVVRKHGLSSQIGYQSTNKNTTVRAGLRLNYLEKFGNFLVEPRLSFNQRLNTNFTVELLGEVKHQTTTQVVDFQNDFLGVENRRWLLSNNNDIPIVKSKQASVGLHYNKKSWLITAEGYYKFVDGITSQSQGFQNQYQFVKTIGNYTVYGADFLINKRFKNSSTWLTYSYVDNKYTFNDLLEITFPNNFDITHSVSLASTYTLKDLKFSAGLNWHSGKPTTALVLDNEVQNGELNYQSANSSRLDDYMRVDISAQYRFGFSKKVKAHAGISIWNLLNEKNELNSYYEYQSTNATVNKITESSLGFTPNVSFRISF
ncbi:MAG: TonB-dependent receptor [Lutibacter sp.]|nr:MAG: TonB-dependent receptor [Lutibacter sp.]